MPIIQPRVRVLYGLVLIPSLTVAVLMATLYFVVLPLAPWVQQYYFTQQAQTFATYQVPLLGHIGFGAIALALGSINLIHALRQRAVRAHPVVGRCYAVAVAISAPCAVFMAFHAYPGTVPGGQIIVTSGLCTLALLWLATLAMAIRAIALNHDVAGHRFWIIVNFSLTFAAVVFRVENSLILATGTFDTLYPFLGWASWVPNIMVGVWLARRLNRARVPKALSGPRPATVQ
ncbi:DUF2306 domain-containing protein [Arthrobacter castelli]|uniref:DUF2306 domain-containing protein n=1 Tax=Arthrobacter castelli TaxID=271431 RepID=UPI0004079525|nr:DUF2306 domain-containing protein [Arthrobacter castelli]